MELLIALFITSIIISAGYGFYITMHNQTLAQEEVSEIQNRSRASLQEIGQTLRMAGYKVGSHPAYNISGDSLSIYFSDTQPVDTVLYFLAETVSSAGGLSDLPSYHLMRQRNSGSPFIYCDHIRSMNFNVISSSEIEVTLVVQATKQDESFMQDDGIRALSMTERVSIRNSNL